MSVRDKIQEHLTSCGVSSNEYILEYTKQEIFDSFSLHNQEKYMPFVAQISITTCKNNSDAVEILNDFTNKISKNLNTMPNFIFTFGDVHIRHYMESYMALTASGVISGIVCEGEL